LQIRYGVKVSVSDKVFQIPLPNQFGITTMSKFLLLVFVVTVAFTFHNYPLVYGGLLDGGGLGGGILDPNGGLLGYLTGLLKNGNLSLTNSLIKNGGLLCEGTTTGALCLLQNITNVLLSHALTLDSPMESCLEFFLSGVHCCDAFCRNAQGHGGGYCDVQIQLVPPKLKGTGACFCDPPPAGESGLPQNCPVLTFPGDSVNSTAFQTKVDDYCDSKCAENNAHGCTSTTYVTAGLLGTVCMCYCP